MKLFTQFNHTFSNGYSIPLDLWNIIDNQPSCNGLFMVLPEYVRTSKLQATTFVEAWSSILQDGNYLYAPGYPEDTNAPEFIINDSLFNNQGSIKFDINGTEQLYLKFPLRIKTFIIVYLKESHGGYLINAGDTLGTPPDIVYFDYFPPGILDIGTIWSSDTPSNNFAYNATTRVNGKKVSPTTFLPLNTVRILSCTNFAGIEDDTFIYGFGGRSGDPNGKEGAPYDINTGESVKGRIAAILTFSEVLDDETLLSIESELANIYVQYTGTVLSTIPYLKTIVGLAYSYDFEPITIDEWYNIESYELLTSGTGLSFSGSILQGTPTEVYDDEIVIRITNSGGYVKDFIVPLEICRADPIVNSLPNAEELFIVLSAEQHSANSTYGVKLDSSGQVIAWDDARRLSTFSNGSYKTIYAQPLEDDEAISLTASYITNEDSTYSVEFNELSNLEFEGVVSAKSFCWVYEQVSYGERYMLDTFPDIKGTGELWSVSNGEAIHGTTAVTQLDTKVQNIQVNTLSFRNPLNTRYIITATHPEDLINFNGFKQLKGKLSFFACWKETLTDTELNTLVNILAQRYFNDFPYVFDTNPVYKSTANIVIDLNTKVVDLEQRSLTWTLNTTYLNMEVDSEGILTLTANLDDSVVIDIDVENSLGNSVNLQFTLFIRLKTNSLYLDLTEAISPNRFNTFFIADSESLTISGGVVTQWQEYIKENINLTSTNVSAINLYQLDNRTACNFEVSGADFFDSSESFTGKSFILVYLRNSNASNRAFLFGQDSTFDFISGNDGILFDTANTSSSLLASNQYINGKQVSNTYRFSNDTCNVVVLNSTNELTIDSIAKDRVFNDSSVKGYIPFIATCNTNITKEEAITVNKLIRDYYQTPKSLLVLNFENNLLDNSDRNKTVSISNTSNVYSSSIRKFGTASLVLQKDGVSRQLSITNNTDFAYLHEDYTIAFWCCINKPLENNSVYTCFNQSGIGIHLHSNRLFIGDSNFRQLALIDIELASSLYSTSGVFFLVELVKSEDVLYLFINGVLQATTSHVYEYRDVLAPCLIGLPTAINTSGLEIYIDNFVIYYRTALHTSNYTVPIAPYS